MKFCGIRRRLVVASCLAALAIGHVAHAGSPQEIQHDNSDAGKTKKKLKGNAKRATAKSRHPGVTIGEALRIDFTGRLEGDVRQATPAIGFDAPEPTWQDRRVGVKGTAFKRITFEVSRELGQDLEPSSGLSEKTAWRDVYARASVTRALSISAGRFKLPFGYEELTGETDLDFIYRSLASRVLAPFSSSKLLTPLSVGLSAARSHLEDELGRGRTVLGDGIFFDRSYVNGARQRIGLDASWADGPASASGEYIWDTDQRLGVGFDGEPVPVETDDYLSSTNTSPTTTWNTSVPI